MSQPTIPQPWAEMRTQGIWASDQMVAFARTIIATFGEEFMVSTLASTLADTPEKAIDVAVFSVLILATQGAVR